MTKAQKAGAGQGAQGPGHGTGPEWHLGKISWSCGRAGQEGRNGREEKQQPRQGSELVSTVHHQLSV